ncbi:uncharacterized protein LOC131428991 [Malaya genurostris]|uniref:uncharacterized protein LOC131428991 n=1 Tax=Malaya genurostris TaxID=325434 RepID=UPI0026F381C6|nr:uncharacterized protein LOC131428991 [Malaya genurostris]
MANMLNSFLSDRTFQVNVENYLSSKYPLKNGVPQGSVLSVTLFLVAMQPIFRIVINTVKVLLYADDILLLAWGKKEQPLYRKLQSAIEAVDRWAKSVGFSFSAMKSSIFYCSPNVRREPKKVLKINQIPIQTQTHLKILGVTLDRSLNFKMHCKLTKKTCESRLYILKIIGARLPRAQRISLLQIGSAIITSRLLYGMGLISKGGNNVINTLTPTYNKTIRFASRAYVTSPIPAIMAEAGTLPFNFLVSQTIARIAINMLEKNSNNASLPLVNRVSQKLVEMVGTPLPDICIRTRPGDRKWYDPKPRILWDIKKLVKAGDPPEIVRPVVQHLLAERCDRTTVIYTDGSKDNNLVGSGVFGEHIQQSIGLPPQCSVFSAEAYAIKTTLARYHKCNNILIMSDSASVLSALESGTSQHPWIQNIETLIGNHSIHLCWIPGHAGIHGNEEADRLAREAKNNNYLHIPTPGIDALQ